MDNCITCSSLRCSSPDRSVQNVLQATQFSVPKFKSSKKYPISLINWALSIHLKL
ncbi:MAG: hypothetical protein AABX07_05020 [Nanoarchaeota archaeon]